MLKHEITQTLGAMEQRLDRQNKKLEYAPVTNYASKFVRRQQFGRNIAIWSDAINAALAETGGVYFPASEEPITLTVRSFWTAACTSRPTPALRSGWFTTPRFSWCATGTWRSSANSLPETFRHPATATMDIAGVTHDDFVALLSYRGETSEGAIDHAWIADVSGLNERTNYCNIPNPLTPICPAEDPDIVSDPKMRLIAQNTIRVGWTTDVWRETMAMIRLGMQREVWQNLTKKFEQTRPWCAFGLAEASGNHGALMVKKMLVTAWDGIVRVFPCWPLTFNWHSAVLPAGRPGHFLPASSVYRRDRRRAVRRVSDPRGRCAWRG